MPATFEGLGKLNKVFENVINNAAQKDGTVESITGVQEADNKLKGMITKFGQGLLEQMSLQAADKLGQEAEKELAEAEILQNAISQFGNTDASDLPEFPEPDEDKTVEDENDIAKPQSTQTEASQKTPVSSAKTNQPSTAKKPTDDSIDGPEQPTENQAKNGNGQTDKGENESPSQAGDSSQKEGDDDESQNKSSTNNGVETDQQPSPKAHEDSLPQKEDEDTAGTDSQPAPPPNGNEPAEAKKESQTADEFAKPASPPVDARKKEDDDSIPTNPATETADKKAQPQQKTDKPVEEEQTKQTPGPGAEPNQDGAKQAKPGEPNLPTGSQPMDGNNTPQKKVPDNANDDQQQVLPQWRQKSGAMQNINQLRFGQELKNIDQSINSKQKEITDIRKEFKKPLKAVDKLKKEIKKINGLIRTLWIIKIFLYIFVVTAPVGKYIDQIIKKTKEKRKKKEEEEKKQGANIKPKQDIINKDINDVRLLEHKRRNVVNRSLIGANKQKEAENSAYNI